MKPYWKVKGNQIGLIHVAKNDLMSKGVLTEESYRDCLKNFGDGAKHANELNQAQMDALLQHFKDCGWVYIPKVRGKAPRGGKEQRNKDVHLEAIRTALGALGKDWAYAKGIAVQMGYPQELEWCSAEQLHLVQIALIYQERREAGNPPQPRPETIAKRRRQAKKRSTCGDACATGDAKAQELGDFPF
ncbi:MAG: DUF1018 domain-containing protein [Deltaproteobacteria bacterium]|nr:MAG: DUF1018 domain-containing protein [Deltaproteobacteria bacterium]